MRAVKIYTDLIDFVSITKCEIKKDRNMHGEAVLRGILKNEEEALDKIDDITWISVMMEDEEGNQRPLFTGIVKSLCLEEENGLKECELTVTGATRLMDITKRTRTFQDAQMTYEELICEINKDCDAVAHSVIPLNKGKEDFFVQYKETDWEFLLRIASNLNTCIIPDFAVKGIRYHVGMPEVKEAVSYDSVCRQLKKEINCFWDYSKSPVKNTQTEDIIQFKHRDLLELGDQVDAQGRDFYVAGIHSTLEGAELVNSYELRRKAGFFADTYYNRMLVGASLDAAIIGVENDCVKVAAYTEPDQAPGQARWFPYSSVFSSPDGTGWYCMPEIGDQVRIYFPGERENNAYVISSVHVDGERRAQGERTTPDHKSIMNKYHKQIEFTPSTITITNGKGMTFKIDDAEGISIVSDKNITFTAQENFSMVSAAKNVEIAACEKMGLKQSGSAIVLDGDITVSGGKLYAQR